jgi:hypothetical protein
MTPSDEAQEGAMVRNGGRQDVGEGENDGDGNWRMLLLVRLPRRRVK